MNRDDTLGRRYRLAADLVMGYACLVLVGVALGGWSLVRNSSVVLLGDTWTFTPAAWFLVAAALLSFLYIGLARRIRSRRYAAIVCTAVLTLALLLLLLVYSVVQRSVFFLETAILVTMSIALFALLRHVRQGTRTDEEARE